MTSFMPDTIYVGLNTPDEDYVDPFTHNPDAGDVGFTPAKQQATDEGYVSEYRLVRVLKVTKTRPAPIITVEEVQA